MTRDDVEGSVPFLCLNDRSPRGRNYLIREICLQGRKERTRMLALPVSHVSEPASACDSRSRVSGSSGMVSVRSARTTGLDAVSGTISLTDGP